MGLTLEQIEQLRAKLRATPKAPPGGGDRSKQEAVRLLVREIEILQDRGWSLEQIGEMLRGGGLVVATPTLKSYLSRAKAMLAGRREAAAKKSAARSAAGNSAAAVASQVAPATAPAETSTTAVRRTAPDIKRAASGSRGEATPAKPAVAPAKSDETTASTADGPKLRSGKDAFLITDKDSY